MAKNHKEYFFMLEKQYVVSTYKVGLKKAIAWLETHGYKNVQNLSEKKYKLSVIVVEGDEFFGTNVTCMAAWCSCGNRVIPFETFIRRHSRR
jgi:hypothetical protein